MKICTYLKKTAVVPTFKSGDQNFAVHYRHISLVSVFSKIIEKILPTRITSYLTKFHLLSDKQFSFREGLSTQDPIALIIRKIYQAIDRKNPILGIIVDLQKKF